MKNSCEKIMVNGQVVERHDNGHMAAYLYGGYAMTVRNNQIHYDVTPYTLTASSTDSYRRLGLPLDSIVRSKDTIEILEIGVGLSEFMPDFALVATKKPVVIGCEDYCKLSILSRAATLSELESDHIKHNARIFARRSDIMQSDQVKYMCSEFEDIFPSLLAAPARFDIIISILSALMYPRNSFSETSEMMRSLLKPKGQILSERGIL